jgi:hypothetical protein
MLIPELQRLWLGGMTTSEANEYRVKQAAAKAGHDK